jgi:hypothetical protein
MDEVRLSMPVALFSLAAGIGAGLLAGVLPVVRLPWRGLADWLRESGRSAGESRRHGTARAVLVAAEIAVALTLLTGAALIGKSLVRLEGTDPGFNPRGVLTFRLTLPYGQYGRDRTGVFLSQLDSRLRALPGVTSVAFASALPPDALQMTNNYTVEGSAPETAGASGVAEWIVVSPAYFQTLGIAVTRGRDFEGNDRRGSRRWRLSTRPSRESTSAAGIRSASG